MFGGRADRGRGQRPRHSRLDGEACTTDGDDTAPRTGHAGRTPLAAVAVKLGGDLLGAPSWVRTRQPSSEVTRCA